jgi:hypothetical protein
VKIQKVLFVAAFLAALFVLVSSSCFAADYYFSVPSNTSDVYINQDGSVTIAYAITFANDSGASPIDVVDIGLPNDSYDLSTAKAWINNTPITEIYKSTYIDTGVEVRLGGLSIPAGKTDTLYFQITNPHMVYTDDEKKDYASVEFSPTWYGSDYTTGTTDVMVNFHFPPGVQPTETVYHHDRKFDTTSQDKDGRIVFTFREPQGSPSSQYMYGVSFPTKYVATVFEPYRPSFAAKVLEFFFNHIFLFFFLGIVGLVVLNLFRARQRKMDYMPADVAIEGVGIKRGLTAPEAALLIDTPLNKVVTMILFGLLKKGIVRVETTPPPKVFKLDGGPTESLKPYEKDFLACVKSDGTLETANLKTALVTMIKETNKALKGFSRTETTDYYRAIVDLGWKMVTEAKTPELLGQEWDKMLEWTMMDKDYDKKMEDTFDGRDVVMPRWYGNYYGPSTVRPSGAGTGGPMKLPGATLANNMVTSVENFSGKLITNVESFVTGVSRVTNPAPQSSGHSSGGGGGGCACACACAGCACACAGGGR